MLIEVAHQIFSRVQESQFFHYETLISQDDALALLKQRIGDLKSKGRAVYIIGNGTSYSLATLTAALLIKNLEVAAYPIGDSSLLSAIGNDVGFEYTCVHPLKTLMKSGDLLLALSTSGRSQNVLAASRWARENNHDLITLTGGGDNNPIKALGFLNLWIPTSKSWEAESAFFLFLRGIFCL
jgi:D-sedoheptulose 7-phosphate isomerase